MFRVWLAGPPGEGLSEEARTGCEEHSSQTTVSSTAFEAGTSAAAAASLTSTTTRQGPIQTPWTAGTAEATGVPAGTTPEVSASEASAAWET